VYAGGDVMGCEILWVFIVVLEVVCYDFGIEVIEYVFVVDLLQDVIGWVCGIMLHVLGEGMCDGVGVVFAWVVVFVIGGLG